MNWANLSNNDYKLETLYCEKRSAGFYSCLKMFHVKHFYKSGSMLRCAGSHWQIYFTCTHIHLFVMKLKESNKK